MTPEDKEVLRCPSCGEMLIHGSLSEGLVGMVTCEKCGTPVSLELAATTSPGKNSAKLSWKDSPTEPSPKPNGGNLGTSQRCRKQSIDDLLRILELHSETIRILGERLIVLEKMVQNLHESRSAVIKYLDRGKP